MKSYFYFRKLPQLFLTDPSRFEVCPDLIYIKLPKEAINRKCIASGLRARAAMPPDPPCNIQNNKTTSLEVVLCHRLIYLNLCRPKNIFNLHLKYMSVNRL